jgi:tetratricopeptide (TPR) repeat protein
MRLVGSAWILILVPLIATAACRRDPEVAKRAYVVSGDAYVAEKDYKAAILQYRNAVQQDPRFGEAHFRLADAYTRDNDLADAARQYIRAGDLLPDNVEAQVKAAQSLLLLRRFDEAKMRADRILAKDLTSVQGQIIRGNALAGLKDLNGAIAEIEKAVALDPDRIDTYGNLGVLELSRGDLKAAEEAFTTAVRIDSTSVPARLALAVFYLSAHRAADAERSLKGALEIDASNPAANQILALMYLASNRQAEAETYLKTVAQVSKTSAARLTLADYYAQTNRPHDAIAILNTLAASDSIGGDIQIRLAATEYAAGQKRQAYERVDKLLSSDPKNAKALLVKAQFLQAEHRLEEALIQATAASQADTRNTHARYLVGRLSAETGRLAEATQAFSEVLTINPHATAALIELARVQLASGRAEDAIQFARQALTEEPAKVSAHLLLAGALIERRQLADADREMSALIAKYPDEPSVQGQMGVLYLSKGDQTRAKRSFERALELDGNSIEALSALVALDLSARRLADARSRVEVALSKTPEAPRLLLLAAGVDVVVDRLDQAEQRVQRAIQIEPNNLQAREMLGALFTSQQKLEQATAVYGAMAKLRPGSTAAIEAQTMVALMVEAQHRPSEAQKQFEAILAESPRAVVAANNLAWLYAEHGGNLDVALGLAQTAAAQAPDHSAINDTLGWIYYKKRLPGHAIAAFQRSIQSDAQNPVYHYHLGLAYAQSGDRAKAKQSLETALRLKADFDGSSEARKLLASFAG